MGMFRKLAVMCGISAASENSMATETVNDAFGPGASGVMTHNEAMRKRKARKAQKAAKRARRRNRR